MSSDQKLEEILVSLASSLEVIKSDELSLDQMLSELSKAVEVAQKFEMHVANENLDVKEVRPFEPSQFKEFDFEWRNM